MSRPVIVLAFVVFLLSVAHISMGKMENRDLQWYDSDGHMAPLRGQHPFPGDNPFSTTSFTNINSNINFVDNWPFGGCFAVEKRGDIVYLGSGGGYPCARGSAPRVGRLQR